jgi:TrpR-related protein YerC/YecD
MAKKTTTTRKGRAADVDAETDALLRAILSLRHVGEARRFFRDLLTDDERDMLGRRWKVVSMLANGDSYRQIEEATAMSSRTVARIAKWLKEGPGGYRIILERAKSRV